MVDPRLALGVVVAGLVLAVVLLWPAQGLLWRAVRALRANDRVRIEDALKHLHDCEYQGSQGTLHSLAGALALSPRKTVELISRLESMELVTRTANGFVLTPVGRREALRIIRVHRLWERYLAEETGLAASEWHAAADAREHTLSEQEVDALAARMGFPRWDPHGDPIPTADGEIAPPLGKPFTELAVGESAEIIHVEDEPEEIYAQLVAADLHPGLRVRITEVSAQRICFEAEAEEKVLAPVLAANLTVVPVPECTPDEGSFERLSGLGLGERAKVTGFSALCRGIERRRLLDLGLIPGTTVEAEMRSAAGDPTAYRIRGAMIALRRSQADLVHVDRAGGTT